MGIKNLEFLCLNENHTQNLDSIQNFTNLKELQINFNSIYRIENLNNLEYLEKIWICENQIKIIENLPLKIKYLWIAFNIIEKLDINLINYQNLYEINLSGNLLSSFNDINILTNLKNLEILNLHDPNFGENPINLISNYRIFLIHMIPNLVILDEVKITKEEKEENKNLVEKKFIFCTNKINNMNKATKSCFKMLKNFYFFYKNLKILKINSLRKRIKMFEYLKNEKKIQHNSLINSENNISNSLDYYKNNHDTNFNSDNNLRKINFTNFDINNNNLELLSDPHELKKNSMFSEENLKNIESNNVANIKSSNKNENKIFKKPDKTKEFTTEFFDEIDNEIELINNKINKALNKIIVCYDNFKEIKKFISQINDFSIIWYKIIFLFYVVNFMIWNLLEI